VRCVITLALTVGFTIGATGIAVSHCAKNIDVDGSFTQGSYSGVIGEQLDPLGTDNSLDPYAAALTDAASCFGLYTNTFTRVDTVVSIQAIKTVARS
jgi:hypothetical protein